MNASARGVFVAQIKKVLVSHFLMKFSDWEIAWESPIQESWVFRVRQYEWAILVVRWLYEYAKAAKLSTSLALIGNFRFPIVNA